MWFWVSWVRAPHRTPNWKENDFDVVLFLFSPDEAGCAFCTGLLFSGSCGIRCRQCILLFGICDTRCRPFYFLVFVILAADTAFSFLALWHSVPERAFYGTEYACRAQKGLLGHATHFQRRAVPKAAPAHRTHFQRRAVPKAAPAAPDASSVRETAPLSLFAPAAPSLAPSTALGARNGPRSEVSGHKKRVTSKSIKTL